MREKLSHGSSIKRNAMKDYFNNKKRRGMEILKDTILNFPEKMKTFQKRTHF